MKPQILFVLGMHRSGTSMVTEALSSCGFHVSKNLLPEQTAINPRGFWEDKDVIALNEKILTEFGSSWFDIRELPQNWQEDPKLEQHYLKAQEIIRNEYSESKRSVIKDPRLCRLLPFWKNVLERNEITAAALIILRSPATTAQSLYARDKIPEEYSSALWITYMDAMVAALDGLNFSIVDYDKLLNAPKHIIQNAMTELALDSSLNLSALDTVVDKSLCHFSDKAFNKPSSPFNRAAQSFYESLLTLDRSNLPLETLSNSIHFDGSFIYSLIENLVNETNEASRIGELHSHALATLKIKEAEQTALVNTYESAAATVKERDTELKEIKLQFETLQASEKDKFQSLLEQFLHAEAIVKQRDEELAKASSDIMNQGKLLAHAEALVKEKDSQLENVNSDVIRQGKLLSHAESVVIERDAQVASLNAALNELEGKHEQLNKQIQNSFFAKLALRYAKSPAED